MAYLPAAELPPMPGDANGDGVVDDLDLATLAVHWEQYGEWVDGDFNRDGFISDSDLALLANAWPSCAGEAEDVSGVPEPATATLLLVLALSLSNGGCSAGLSRKR